MENTKSIEYFAVKGAESATFGTLDSVSEAAKAAENGLANLWAQCCAFVGRHGEEAVAIKNAKKLTANFGELGANYLSTLLKAKADGIDIPFWVEAEGDKPAMAVKRTAYVQALKEYRQAKRAAEQAANRADNPTPQEAGTPESVTVTPNVEGIVAMLEGVPTEHLHGVLSRLEALTLAVRASVAAHVEAVMSEEGEAIAA